LGGGMRRREISPEFWTDEKVVAVSDAAKLLFIGAWHIADREGRLEDRPVTIAMKVRPWDAASGPKAFEELVAIGLLARYEVDGVRLVWIPAFRRWQRPHPNEQPSVLPPHPDDQTQVDPGTSDDGGSIGSPRRSSRSTKVIRSRAGSSGSSGPSGSLRTSQDHRDLSGPSEQSPVQARIDGGEDPTGRKISHWVKLWEEKLSVARLMRIAANEYTTVEDPLFDVEEHDLDLKPQTINAVLKKVSEDLAKKFSSPEKPWTLAERLEAVEQAWEAYLTSHFGAGVDPPYALNAFASPKTSIPSYERAKAEA